jgi:hemerythrin-like domain-containing protein
MRYKFYREHKFVSAAVNDVERLIAKTDFSVPVEVAKVRHAFDGLVGMLKSHAHYENEVLHQLLKKKNSAVYEHVELDHEEYEAQLADLENRLNKVIVSTEQAQQVELGYEFYLWFRKFAGDNLVHLHEEETVILPELQRLYSDAELSVVEFDTYRVMSSQDLVHMLEILFPHMNPSDREAFLTDIQACDGAKFAAVWGEIQSKLDPHERMTLAHKLRLIN